MSGVNDIKTPQVSPQNARTLVMTTIVDGKTVMLSNLPAGVSVDDVNAAALKGGAEFAKFCQTHNLTPKTFGGGNTPVAGQNTGAAQAPKPDTGIFSTAGNYHAGSVSSKEIQAQVKAGDVTINPTGIDYNVKPQTHTVGMDKAHTNPDAGIGAAVVKHETVKNTVNLANIPPEVRAQSPFKELLGAGDKAGNYEIKPENQEKLEKALAEYYSTPNNVEIAGDEELTSKIKQELVNQGVYDEQGNVKDANKLAEITKNGITINGKAYTFTSEAGEPVALDVTKTTKTEVSSKFKEMDPKAAAKIGSDQLAALEKQGFVTKVGNKYYTTQEGLQLKTSSPTVNATDIKPEELVGDKKMQDIRETQLQKEALTMYDSNPENAQDTLLHTKYYKEYKKLEDSLIEINNKDNPNTKNKDYGNQVAYRRKGILARQYFAESKDMKGNTVHEYATEADIAKFKKDVEARKGDLAKFSQQELIDKYKTFFGDVNDANIDSLGESQLQELAEAMVYNEGLSDSQVKHMASTQFKNRFNTKMNNVYQDYQEKIYEARQKGKSGKADKLEAKMEKELRAIAQEKVETENKDRSDYANMVARGQLNSEIGEGAYKKANPTYASIIADVPEAKDFIQKNHDKFFITNMTTGEEVFNTQAWKEFFLDKSSSREDNNTDGNNNKIQDYYMTLGEAQNVVRGNARGAEGQKYVGLRAIFPNKSDNELENISRKMAGTAGIQSEANNTAGIRTGYVFSEIGKGVVGAAAADILTNAVISKIRIPYAGTVAGTVTGTVSGSVTFARSGVIKDLDTFVTKNYDNGELVSEIKSEVTEYHKWSTEGEEPYSKNYSKDYTKGYKGKKGIGDFHVDPWAVAAGGVAGAIKGLASMHKKHDKQDGKSEVQMYARRDFNEKDTSNVTERTQTKQIQTKKYVAKLEDSTAGTEDIPNITHKMTVKYGGVDKNGRPYNLGEDKEQYVADFYGVQKGSPEFQKIYKYVMEDINGVTQYKAHQYKNDKTYVFPETLPKEVTGFDKDYKKEKEPEKKWVKIPLARGVRTNITGKARTIQGKAGHSASATITASHKRRKA